MRANNKRRDGIREEKRTRQDKTIEDKMREERGLQIASRLLTECFQIVCRTSQMQAFRSPARSGYGKRASSALNVVLVSR